LERRSKTFDLGDKSQNRILFLFRTNSGDQKIKKFFIFILIELITRDTLCLTGKWPPRDLEASLFQATTVKGFRFRNPSLLGRSDLLPRPAPHLEVSTGENEVLVPE
jgi:hypothetical protein